MFILLLYFLFGCKQNSDTAAINDTAAMEVVNQYDTSKSKELIRLILAKEEKDYFNTNCIVEKVIPMYVLANSNVARDVTEKLSIKDTIHLNEQMKLYKQFKLTPDLVPDKSILTQQHFLEFEKKKPFGKSSWVMIEPVCEDGYSYILKPIFNEDYTIAYVQFGNFCGSYCGGGEIQVYEYRNGGWHKARTISSWVA